MKLPDFTRPLYKVGEYDRMFFFLNLNTVLSDSTRENLANIWQIYWNWIRSEKSETVPIHFLSDVYRSVVVQKFCYHGNVTKRLLLTLAIWVRVRVILRNEIRSNLDKMLEAEAFSTSRTSLCLAFALNWRNNHELWNIAFKERHRACFLVWY